MYSINPWVSRSDITFFTASTPNLQDPSGYGTCSLPGCTRPKYRDPANGRVHNFCGRTHATQARAQGLCHSCLCNFMTHCHCVLEGMLSLVATQVMERTFNSLNSWLSTSPPTPSPHPPHTRTLELEVIEGSLAHSQCYCLQDNWILVLHILYMMQWI